MMAKVAPVAGSVLFWTALYRGLCYLAPTGLFRRHFMRPSRTDNPHAAPPLSDVKTAKEWNNRLVTAAHATSVLVVLIPKILIIGPMPWHELGQANKPFHSAICIWSLGYFLFDFAWCLAHRTEGPAMLAHHLTSLCGLSFIHLVGRYGSELMSTICGAEFSNPFLQMRWFLRQTNRGDTKLAGLFDLLFMLAFVGARFGPGNVLYYYSMKSDKLDWFIKAAATAFHAIDVVFLVQMYQWWKKRSSRRKREKAE